MTCYVIADIEVIEAEPYREYQCRIPDTLPPYGGRFIVRGEGVIPLEGAWNPSRMIVIEFPTLEQASAWWDSPENLELRALRNRYTVSRLVMVPGVD